MHARRTFLQDRIVRHAPNARVRRVRWSSWGGAALAAAVLVTLYIRSVGGELGDFDAYYAAAESVRDGVPLYEHAFTWRDAGFAVNYPGPRPMADRYPGVNTSPFVYPAAFALAFVPATLLPIDTARALWFTLVFGCLIAAAGVLAAIFFPQREPAQRVAVWLGLAAALALFQPTRASLSNGQVDAVLLLLLSLSLLAFLRKQDGRAGVWLALAASVKPFLGFLLLYYVWKGASRTVLTTVGLSAAILLLPTLYFGLDILIDFATVALYWSSPAFAVSPFNQSVYGLSLRLFTVNAYTVPVLELPHLATGLRVVVAAAVLGFLLRFVSRTRRAPHTSLGLEFGLTVVGMLLVAPLAQDIYYIHLGVPLVAISATLRATWSWQSQQLLLAAGTAAATLYLCLPTLRSLSMGHYAFHDAPLSGLQVLQTGAHTYGLLAVAVMTCATVAWRWAAEHRVNVRLVAPTLTLSTADLPDVVRAGGVLDRDVHLSATTLTPTSRSVQ